MCSYFSFALINIFLPRKTDVRDLTCEKVNHWFIRKRAFIEIWSSRGVWRARKMHKSGSRRSQEQLLLLECSPNFPSASYLDERTDDVWTNCFITFSTRWEIFFSRDLFADVMSVHKGIWSTLGQLNLIRQIYWLCYKNIWWKPRIIE